MGLFSRTPPSTLPPEILGSVRTMQDDLDGKAPTPQSVKESSLSVSGSASPFKFESSPALKNMSPVNENGLTSPITVTNTDKSHAVPDPKDSSPFLQSNSATEPSSEAGDGSLALDPLPPKPTPSEKPAPTKFFSTMNPSAVPISFSKEAPRGQTASFVSENVTLGSDDPVYASEVTVKKKSGILLAGIILLVIAVVAGGAFAYFSFFAKKPPVASDMPAKKSVNETLPPVTSDVAPSIDAPFSLSSPNYLSIDVETITAEQFRGMLSLKEKLLESNHIVDTPIEFFVTDKNNTPVAFARFATLMGITFPEAVMGQIDEAFSLYLYSDGHVARVGLSLSLKDKDLLHDAVMKGESAIPFALQALYLDPTVTKIATPVFKSGTYKTYSTRYFNIGSSGLSNDYTFTEKHWVIGTSANAFRKILDTFGSSL